MTLKSLVLLGCIPWACEGEVASSAQTGNAAQAVAFGPRFGPNVAIGPQVDDQLDTIYAGADGALYVAWMNDGNSTPYFEWDGPVRISPTGLVPANAGVAVAKQLSNQTDAFFIGYDGALYVTWVVDRGTWANPVRITNTGVAPAGSAVTAIKQFDYHFPDQPHDQLDVFFVGNDGGIYVTWVVDQGVWHNPPVRITNTGVAPAGGIIAAAKQFSNQLDIFYVGTDGGIWVSWSVNGGVWNSPVRITDGGVAPPGGGLSAEFQYSDPFTSQLDVLYFGNNGGVYVTWSGNGGAWHYPAVGISAPSLAPAGAGIALARETSNKLDAFYVGNDGTEYIMSVQGSGVWQAPQRVTMDGNAAADPLAPSPNLAQPGATISAALLGDQMNVAFASRDGTPYASYFHGAWDHNANWGWWRRICPCGPGQTYPSGDASNQWVAGSTTRLAQLTGNYDPQGLTHLNNTYNWGVAGVDLGTSADYYGTTIFLFGDVVRPPGSSGARDLDLMAYTTYSNPEPYGPQLTPIMSGGTFYPFTVTRGSVTAPLGSNQTPTGAFQYGSRFYAFYWMMASDQPAGSYLAYSTNPWSAQPYTQLFGLDGRFSQVAPVFVTNGSVPGLPAGDGVVLLGQGWNPGIHSNAFHLAWMPLDPNGALPTLPSILYWTGNGWSWSAASAVPLWTNRGYSAASLAYVSAAKKWVATYSRAWDWSGNNESIVARVGTTPWSWSSEVAIFNPCREQAIDRFFHWPGLDNLYGYEYTWMPDDSSWAYGAFLVNRYIQWDSVNHVLTLYFLMSASRPYQVQFMKTKIRTDIPAVGGGGGSG